MKKIFKLVALIILGFNVYAQEQILPLNNTYVGNIPNGAYVKDINNDFLPFVGVWKSSFGGRDYFLKIILIPHHQISFPNGDSYYKDILVSSYEVRYPSGEVLQGNLNDINPNLAKIRSIGYPKDSRQDFIYEDIELCDYTARLKIVKIPPNPNILEYYFEFEEVSRKNCPYDEDFPIPIPNDHVTFTKVN